MFFLRKNSIFFLMAVSLLSCGQKGEQKGNTPDSPREGTIHISVDETFKPVIDSQIQVYESSYPNVKIIAHYKPEADCLKDLYNDSIRLIIVTRILSKKETEDFKGSYQFAPSYGKMAYDAISVIVNNKSADTIYKMSEIRDLLSGKTDKKEVVFDGTSATSTVRFAIDSILMGASLGSNVKAANSSEEVIDYVSKTPNAVGFVGVSWIGNKDDARQLSFLETVKIASLECKECPPGIYVKPYQANIIRSRYPLVRELYYIVKENYLGLGKGFANFMTHERGQLIFKRAYLTPAKMSFTVRKAKLSE